MITVSLSKLNLIEKKVHSTDVHVHQICMHFTCITRPLFEDIFDTFHTPDDS